MLPYGNQKFYIVTLIILFMKKKEMFVNTINMNEAYNKILQWFFSYSLSQISLTDLSSNLKISKRTASIIVNDLVKKEFLIKEEVGRVWRIHCNQKHFYNFTKKISFNLSMIYSLLYESNLIDEIYRVTGNFKAVVLFGSYRKGDDTDKSDIDLAVEVAGNEDIKIIDLVTLKKFGYRKNVTVNLHIFSRNKIDLNLFSNITNGIVLEGFLE